MSEKPIINKSDELSLSEYAEFFTKLKNEIWQSQILAAVSLNKEVILLYWKIGKSILQKQATLGWGAKVIDRLSKDLKKEFPAMKGFSQRNLKYMRAFAENWRD